MCGLGRVIGLNSFNDGAGDDGVPLVNHPNAIRPACPMSRVSQPHGAAEAQTTKTQREGGTHPGRVSDACPCLIIMVGSERGDLPRNRRKKLARAAHNRPTRAMRSADLPPFRCGPTERHGGLTTWRADPGRNQGG